MMVTQRASGSVRRVNRKVLVVTGVVLLSLASCCGLCMVAGVVADAPGGAASSELNGRYECQMPTAVLMNGMLMPQYQPAGMWFVIDDGSYSCSSEGGAVAFDAQVVRFTGGGYDGWVGAREEGVIIFRENHADPRPGESVRYGDLRCALVK